MSVSFKSIEGWVSDAASSAVTTVEALTHLGHVADTPEAQKGLAVKFVEKIVGAKLEAYGLSALEPVAFRLIDPMIEWALEEAKVGADHLPGGFGGLVAGIISRVDGI